MDIKEIVDMTQQELRAKEADLRQELFNLRLQARGGRVEKPSRIRDLRRDVARVKTILTGKIAQAAVAVKAKPAEQASQKTAKA